jgi:hypothetical protein
VTETRYDILGLAQFGQHDHWNLGCGWVALQMTCDLITAHRRKVDIENHRSGLTLDNGVYANRSVIANQDFHSKLAQVHGDCLRLSEAILHQHDEF